LATAHLCAVCVTAEHTPPGTMRGEKHQ